MQRAIPRQRMVLLVLVAWCLASSSPVRADGIYKNVNGRVVDASGSPVAGADVTAPCTTGNSVVQSDADGKFIFAIDSGNYGVMVLATTGDRMGVARTGNAAGEPINLLIALGETKTIEVAVQKDDGHSVPGARVDAVVDKPALPDIHLPPLKTNDQGKATLRFPADAKCRAVCARSPDGQLGGLLITGPADKRATIKVQPLGGIMGQLVDAEGHPLAKRHFHCGVLVREGNEAAPWMHCFGVHGTSDNDGEFVLRGLVVGGRYRIVDIKSQQTLALATVESTATAQLGKITATKVGYAPAVDLTAGNPPGNPTAPKANDLSALDQQILQSVRGDPNDKYAKAKEGAGSYRQRIALLLVDPKADATRQLMELRKDKEVRLAMDNFRLIFVDATSEPAKALTKSLDVKLAASDALPQIIVRDPAGAAVAAGEAAEISVGGQIDKSRFIDWLHANALEPLDARKLLDDALADARKTGRRVLVQETAVWCGPCHMVSDYLERQRAIWDKDFIWIRLDERWTHNKEVVAGLRTASSGGGIPWLAVLDADGQVLATHLGYPGNPAMVDKFLAMLKETSHRLTEDDLARLREPLEQK
jgi:hypothetical protein